MSFRTAVIFGQGTRIPENRFWTTMGSLCMAERAVECVHWFSSEIRFGIIWRLHGNGSTLARPLLNAAVEEAHVLVPVVEKRPSDQTHVLVRDIVDDDCAAVADAELSRD